MAIVLEPVVGEDLWVNKWNWHPTIELLVRAGIFSADRAEPLHYNCGGNVSAAEALQIEEYLAVVLMTMTQGERLLIDGQTTSAPDSGELHRGIPWNQNYAATFEWLQNFHDFCKTSQGFSIL